MTLQWRQAASIDPALDPYWGWARANGFRWLTAAGDKLRLAAHVAREADVGAMFAAFKAAGIEVNPTARELAATPIPFVTLSLRVNSKTGPNPLDRLLPVIQRFCDRIELCSPIVTAAAVDLRIESAQPIRSQSRVVVAYMDDACPFAHPKWRGRVLALWQQGAAAPRTIDGKLFGRPSGRGYGVEYHRKYSAAPPNLMSISEALGLAQYAVGGGVDEAALYADAGFPILAHRDSHGAHVLDLLAGRVPLSSRLMSGPMTAPTWEDGTDFAADADIIAVQLPRDCIEDTSGRWLVDKVLDTLWFVMGHVDPAVTKRVVLNASYGPTTGPHDGSALLEQALDAWCTLYDGTGGRPALEVVLPAGNSFQWRSHAAATLQPNQPVELVWRVINDGYRPSFAELWFTDATDPAKVEVIVTMPGGLKSPQLVEGVHELVNATGKVIAVAALLKLVGWSAADKLVFLLALEPTAMEGASPAPAPAGDWRIEVANRGGAAVDLNAYIQRGSTHMHFRRRTDTMSWFVAPDYDRDAYLRRQEDDLSTPSVVRRRGTLSGVATGSGTKVATGYRLSDKKHVVYASAGRTRDGRPKLAGALPIDETRSLTGLRAAGNLGPGMVRLVGTSLAAPLLARHLASRSFAGAPREPVPPTPPNRDGPLLGPKDFPPP